MSPLNTRVLTMDRVAKNCNEISLKLANSTMAMAGLAIILYSVWMIIICLRDYPKYPISWFAWACFVTGAIFCFIACIGHAGADTRSNFLLSLYILFMFLLILMESLVTADVCLNDKWEKDFPKDPTERFDDFVHYVESNFGIFKCLGLLIAFSQIASFLLAMILRIMGPDSYQDDTDALVVSAKLPLLNPQTQHPHYVFGHPHYYSANLNNVLGVTLFEDISKNGHTNAGVSVYEEGEFTGGF